MGAQCKCLEGTYYPPSEQAPQARDSRFRYASWTDLGDL